MIQEHVGLLVDVLKGFIGIHIETYHSHDILLFAVGYRSAGLHRVLAWIKYSLIAVANLGYFSVVITLYTIVMLEVCS